MLLDWVLGCCVGAKCCAAAAVLMAALLAAEYGAGGGDEPTGPPALLFLSRPARRRAFFFFSCSGCCWLSLTLALDSFFNFEQFLSDLLLENDACVDSSTFLAAGRRDVMGGTGMRHACPLLLP